jgi:transcriptional regulator PpsR
MSGLAPELAEMLASFACDIALILDDGGVIQSVSISGSHPGPDQASEWIGQRWADTVSPDLRPKAESFLDDIANTGVSRVRHISHSSGAGAEIPMAYSAVRLGQRGPTLAVGRDMRLVAAMQERLTQTQREMERQHWQRRHSDSRYRLLFQIAKEAMLIVDASNYEILDANGSAKRLLANAGTDLIQQNIGQLFSAATRDGLHRLLESACRSTRIVSGEAARLRDAAQIEITVSPVNSESAAILCVVLRDPAAIDQQAASGLKARSDERFAALFERSGDAIAICNIDGVVVFVNDALLDLAQLPRSETMLNRNISEWIGSPDLTKLDILNLARSAGPVCLLGCDLRRKNSGAIGVEISATLLADFGSIGFIVRLCHAHGMATENPGFPSSSNEFN